MDRLVPVKTKEAIPSEYRGTAIESLFDFHNLSHPYPKYTNPELLVGMCMDNRKHLRIPDNFAFIIRTGGANLRYSEFKVSFALAVGGVRSIALIGHNKCGMVHVMGKRDAFIEGLVSGAGWSKEQAEEHFHQYAPMFEIGNEIDFVLSEVRRLRDRYPKIKIAPMVYRLEDNLLYLIRES